MKVEITFPRTGNGGAFCETCFTFVDWHGCVHDRERVFALLPKDEFGLPMEGTIEYGPLRPRKVTST